MNRVDAGDLFAYISIPAWLVWFLHGLISYDPYAMRMLLPKWLFTVETAEEGLLHAPFHLFCECCCLSVSSAICLHICVRKQAIPPPPRPPPCLVFICPPSLCLSFHIPQSQNECNALIPALWKCVSAASQVHCRVSSGLIVFSFEKEKRILLYNPICMWACP